MLGLKLNHVSKRGLRFDTMRVWWGIRCVHLQCISSDHVYIFSVHHQLTCTSSVYIISSRVHLQCTSSAHVYIFSVYHQLMRTSSVYIISSRVHLQCTSSAHMYIFSVHHQLTCTSSVYIVSSCSSYRKHSMPTVGLPLLYQQNNIGDNVETVDFVYCGSRRLYYGPTGMAHECFISLCCVYIMRLKTLMKLLLL